MTSDTAPASSQARQDLDLALGKKRVSLSALLPEEFDALLRNWLFNTKLKEIRGFKPLKEFLAFRSEMRGVVGVSATTHGFEELNVADDARLIVESIDHEVSLSSQVISVSRGPHDYDMIYRRHESDEETRDWKVANSWGMQGYLHRGHWTLLALGRLHQHAHADDALVEIRYWYEKVKYERKHLARKIAVTGIPIARFREHFGEGYGQVALNLVWELTSIHSRTRDALKSQLDAMERRYSELDRLGDSLTK